MLLLLGLAPVANAKQFRFSEQKYPFPPNDYQIYNMLGNVWEWVSGGSPEKRILRGGSYIDSSSGLFNHAVTVATKQINSGDSSATNLGFRCVQDYTPTMGNAENIVLEKNIEHIEL